MSETSAATRSVVVEKEFAHAPEKVWRALTEGELIRQWLMENDFEPEQGRQFQFRAQPMPGWSGLIDCEVLALTPLERLSYSWATMGTVTVVTWTLTPTPGGTLVRMEQSGFGADQEAAYKGATYGWRRFLGEMERVVGEMREGA